MLVFVVTAMLVSSGHAQTNCPQRPADPPGSDAQWYLHDIIYNHVGPPILDPTRLDVVNLLPPIDKEHFCENGPIPCEDIPPLPLDITYSESLTEQYSISTTASLSAASSLATKLIAEVRASIAFTGAYSRTKEETFEWSASYSIPACTRFVFSATAEKRAGTGTIRQARVLAWYRLADSQGSIVGSEIVECDARIESGSATGVVGQFIKSAFKSCHCCSECEE